LSRATTSTASPLATDGVRPIEGCVKGGRHHGRGKASHPGDPQVIPGLVGVRAEDLRERLVRVCSRTPSVARPRSGRGGAPAARATLSAPTPRGAHQPPC
jgi:hypothetical protein